MLLAGVASGRVHAGHYWGVFLIANTFDRPSHVEPGGTGTMTPTHEEPRGRERREP